MAPYCEAAVVQDHCTYELYSVVIHSGSTHSGHYTAFIRDVDDLGHWMPPVSSIWWGIVERSVQCMEGSRYPKRMANGYTLCES